MRTGFVSLHRVAQATPSLSRSMSGRDDDGAKEQGKRPNEGQDDPVFASTAFGHETLTVCRSNLLQLVHACLLECGLPQTSRALLQETDGAAALPGTPQAHLLPMWCRTGQWAQVLRTLESVNLGRRKVASDRKGEIDVDSLLQDVHELAILELAASAAMANSSGHGMSVAFAMLRICQDRFGERRSDKSSSLESNGTVTMMKHIPRWRVVEHRIQALQASPNRTLPEDYFQPASGGASTDDAQIAGGSHSKVKQTRRNMIASAISDAVPSLPQRRLSTLLQQALKWQAFTGQVSLVDVDDAVVEENSGQDKKKKKRKHDVAPRFDLLLGRPVDCLPDTTVGDLHVVDHSPVGSLPDDYMISKPWSTVSFGKSARCHAALFLPDGSGLVTGSSDGLIEIWDPSPDVKYRALRTHDLPYQAKEELMGHSMLEGKDKSTEADLSISVLATSSDGLLLASASVDGQVCVWKIDSGKCVRRFVNGAAPTCMTFLNSDLLIGARDGVCRAWRLRTQTVRQEFSRHDAYVTCCQYIAGHNVGGGDHKYDDEISNGSVGPGLRVATASGDGTVRFWDAHTGSVLCIMSVAMSAPASIGASLVVQGNLLTNGAPPVVVFLCCDSHMIVVPRGPVAYRVDDAGIVRNTYSLTSSSSFVIAAMSRPRGQWLYGITDDGQCHVWDAKKGTLERSIADFGHESTRSGSKSTLPEISDVVVHPHRGILAAFSHDFTQKRGILELWK